MRVKMEPIKLTPGDAKPTRRRVSWDVQRTLDLMEVQFSKLVGIPREDESALQQRWLAEVLSVDRDSCEDPPEQIKPVFFLADAMGLCWGYVEDGQEEGERLEMALCAQKLNTKARHLLRDYERQFSTFEVWAKRRHEGSPSQFRLCRFPHRHFLFCLVPAKVLRCLADVVDSTEMMVKRFPVGLRIPNKVDLRHIVALRLNAAGFSHAEGARLLDPDGFSADKAKATLSFRKLVKRAGKTPPPDISFSSLVRPRTSRFRR
jgi:hypothetical protein